MGVLSGLKPERVFYYFEEICKIPHGSYNCGAVSDYCVGVAKKLGLEVWQDEFFNVVIKKAASAGYENAPSVMIQGHLDMVCVKDADKDFDFEKDGLDLILEDGYVRADRTTLGADDGIAVAMALAILEDNSLKHPALEVVFTTEEEVGMEGATGLDTTDLKAKYLLNIDSEVEGIFTAGCAGGVKARAAFEVEREMREGTPVRLAITGLKGGHSGAEIHKCRANAMILLGRVLFALHQEIDLSIVKVWGGAKDNAIPVEAYADLVIDLEDEEQLQAIVDGFAADLAVEFRTSDPAISVTTTVNEAEEVPVFTRILAEKIIFMLMQIPNGIQTMSADLPGLVESSLNLGILETTEDEVAFTWAIRSSINSLKYNMRDKLAYITEFLGGEILFRGEYPAWPFDPDSRITSLAKSIYEDMQGKAGTIETIHAGLECGLLSEKMPGLDMVSIGPNMDDIHTSKERLEIASVERCYGLVLRILEALTD